MLGFFRKYQKFFFVFVTCVIAISFTFFGTSRAFSPKEKIPDREIGKLYDGSKLMERRLQGLIAILSHGIEEGSRTPNLLNGSLVHRELILSGLGEILAEHLFDDLKDELEEKWQRAKNYAPYQHPFAQHVSAKQIWTQYAPEILGALEEVKGAPAQFSKEQLKVLFHCYQAQGSFPPSLLHRILFYREQQGQGIRLDPGLPQANVALFGFQTVEDWFGKTFIEELGKFILNAACFASQEGYGVSIEEARADLFTNVVNGIKTFKENQPIDLEEAQKIYSAHIQRTGLSENEAVELWAKVLTFQRYFSEVGNAVFIDTLFFDQFKKFSKPSNQICRYNLPDMLKFDSFWEMLKFQRYKEIVSDNEDILALPTHLKDPQEVMDTHPDLIYKTFTVELSSVSKDEVAARISLKETWDWESEIENYATIQNQFSQLRPAFTLEGRLEALDALDQNLRFQVDQFARNALVDAHLEWIDNLLVENQPETIAIKVRLKEEGNPFSGSHILALLESEDSALNRYSVDGNQFYKICVVEKGTGWNFVPFEEASMDEKLDQMLMTAYEEIGFKEPFEEVKEEVGRAIYADLFAAIGEDVKQRFNQYLENMRKLAIEDPDTFAVHLEDPFALEKSVDEVAAVDESLNIGDFASVEDGGFYQLLAKSEVLASEEDLTSAKKHLRREAQAKLMSNLIAQFYKPS